MAIDYKVGDVIKPKAEYFMYLTPCLVLDITEKGAICVIVGQPVDRMFEIPNSCMELMTKDEVGTTLYGNKEE
jgi:hypothetical protein